MPSLRKKGEMPWFHSCRMDVSSSCAEMQSRWSSVNMRYITRGSARKQARRLKHKNKNKSKLQSKFSVLVRCTHRILCLLAVLPAGILTDPTEQIKYYQSGWHTKLANQSKPDHDTPKPLYSNKYNERKTNIRQPSCSFSTFISSYFVPPLYPTPLQDFSHRCTSTAP